MLEAVVALATAPVTLPPVKLVKLDPPPEKLVAVIVPAEKFPDASLITIVLIVFAVAVLIHVGTVVPPLTSS